jgi:hypothetical protein
MKTIDVSDLGKLSKFLDSRGLRLFVAKRPLNLFGRPMTRTPWLVTLECRQDLERVQGEGRSMLVALNRAAVQWEHLYGDE